MRTVRIGLSGPTGSGKTTLAGMLARHPEVTVVKEVLPQEQFRGFALDPCSWCFRLERSIILGRANFHLDGQQVVTAFDRTVDEDVEVFIRMHRENGLLSDCEAGELAHLAEGVRKRVGSPDLYVFMTAPFSILAQRVAAARAPKPIQVSLNRQIVLYDEWKRRLRAPILEVDTGMTEPQQLPEIGDWILCSLSDTLTKEERTRGPGGISWSLGQAGQMQPD